MTVYLRQKTTGHISVSTPSLLARNDMEPYDPALAEKRIEAAKKKLAEIEASRTAPPQDPEAAAKMTEDSKILAELETQIQNQTAMAEAVAEGKSMEGTPKTETEQVEKSRQDRIDEDLEVRKIRAMVSKAEVQEYSLLNYGIEFGQELQMKEMKRLAVEERKKIIFAKG
jgi:hypothetical protein